MKFPLKPLYSTYLLYFDFLFPIAWFCEQRDFLLHSWNMLYVSIRSLIRIDVKLWMERKDWIRELYHLRWGIESSFRDLKYTMGLVNLHGKSDCFVEQELYAAMTMFNFTSRIARGLWRHPVCKAYKAFSFQVPFVLPVWSDRHGMPSDFL